MIQDPKPNKKVINANQLLQQLNLGQQPATIDTDLPKIPKTDPWGQDIEALNLNDILNDKPTGPRTGFLEGLNKKFSAGAYSLGEAITEIPQFAEAAASLPYQWMSEGIIKRKARRGEITPEDADNYLKNIKDYAPKADFLQSLPTMPGTPTLGEAIADSKLNKWLNSTAKQLNETNNRYNKTVSEYIKSKEYGKALGAEAFAISESLPSTLAAMFVPGGWGALGLTTGSQTYDEVKDRDDMAESMKVIDGLSTGLFEAIFEKFGTAEMGNMLSASYGKIAKDKVEDAVKSSTLKLLEKSYKKFGVWFAPIHEGLSESLTTLGQNATAKFTGEDPNREITDGVVESFLVGFGMGGVFAGTTKGLEALANRLNQKSTKTTAPSPGGPISTDLTQAGLPSSENIPLDQSINPEIGPLTVPGQEIAQPQPSQTPLADMEEQVMQNFVPIADAMEKFRSKEDGDLHMFQDQRGQLFYMIEQIDEDSAMFISAETVEGQPVNKMIKGLLVMQQVETLKYDDWANTVKTNLRAGLQVTQQAADIEAAKPEPTAENSYNEEWMNAIKNPDPKITVEQVNNIRDRVIDDMVNGQTFSDEFLNKLEIAKPEVAPVADESATDAAPVQQTEAKSFPVTFSDKKLMPNKAIEQPNGTYMLEQPYQNIDDAQKAQKDIEKRFGHKGYTATIESKSLDESNPFADEIHQVRINTKPVPTVSPEKTVVTKEPVKQSPGIELRKKRQWPMSKADEKRITQDPASFSMAVYQFFLAGGRVKTADLIRYAGIKPGTEEFRRMIWAYSNNGISLDVINEIPGFEIFMAGMEGMDAINAFIDVMQGVNGKNAIRERFDAMINNQGEARADQLPEDIAEQEEIDNEETVSELSETILANPEILNIFVEYSNESGDIDFEKMGNLMKADPSKFKYFPFQLTDEAFSELSNIINDVEKQRSITELYKRSGGPESKGKRDELFPGAENLEDGTGSQDNQGQPRAGTEERTDTTESAEVTQQSPEDIASQLDLTYQGQWKDENDVPIKDEYKINSSEANITVPIGSDLETVKAKVDEKLSQNITPVSQSLTADQGKAKLATSSGSDFVDTKTNEVKNNLLEKGYEVLSGGDSKTDFGHSRYLLVNRIENPLNNPVKVRISDHSVSNVTRMFGEVHFGHSDRVEWLSYKKLDYLLRPELFREENGMANFVTKFETPKPIPSDKIISERPNKAGTHNVYTVERTTSKPVTRIIDIRDNFVYSEKINEVALSQFAGDMLKPKPITINDIADLFPDDIVSVKLKDGTTQDMSFRGWDKGQAIVYNKKVGQFPVDKTDIIGITKKARPAQEESPIETKPLTKAQEKQKASEAGKAAFEAGLTRVPIHDPALVAMLAGKEVGQSKHILDAWLKAYDKANLAKPVEETYMLHDEQELVNWMDENGYEDRISYDWDGEVLEIFMGRDTKIVEIGRDQLISDGVKLLQPKTIELKQEELKADPNPTEGQKDAGNYQKGHISIHGMDISIENAKGSIREGVDKSGAKWLTTMNNTYGYFRGTIGRDKDHVDVFIGENLNPDNVFIIDQTDPATGKFDELKVMLGFDTETQAEFAYYLNYQTGWQGLGAISTMPIAEFKEWISNGKPKNSPLKYNKPEPKLVSDDRMAELRQRMRDKLNKNKPEDIDQVQEAATSYGKFDPEMFAMGAEMAAYHIESGAGSFEEFAKAMITDLGPDIKPFLKSFYNGARDFPGLNNSKMTAYDAVSKINLDDIELSNNLPKISQDAQRQSGDIEPSGTGTDTGISDNQTPVQAEAGRGGSGITESDKGIRADIPDTEAGRTSANTSNVVSGNITALSGQPGDIELQLSLGGFETAASPSPSIKPRRGSVDNIKGDKPDVQGQGNTDSVLQKRQTGVPKTPIILGNLASIKESVPLLLPEQIDDVLKAETRFFTGINQGRGMLFTNGTGTGKTYSGLGIIQRTIERVKEQGNRLANILIVVPSDQKILDWIREGAKFPIEINALTGITDKGKGGVIITTYANFTLNNDLKRVDFDLIMYDESHRLMSDQKGKESGAVMAHRLNANHPRYALEKQKELNGLWTKEKEISKKFHDFWIELTAKYRANDINYNTYKNEEEALFKLRDEQLEPIIIKQNQVLPELERKAKEGIERTKAVFLSATPFNSHQTLEYVDQFIVDMGSDDSMGKAYNAGSARDLFFVSNFGYRIRYNKLTVPDADVDVPALERAFFDKLVKQGAVSGRALMTDFDYSREFPIVLGDFADTFNEIFDHLNSYERYKHLDKYVRFKFYNNLYSNQLFENLKSGLVVPRIQKHQALGRKVVVFHRYVNSGTLPHPFDFSNAYYEYYDRNKKSIVRKNIQDDKEALKELAQFENSYPNATSLRMDLRNPIDQLKDKFGENVVVFNGKESKAVRRQNLIKFNAAGSGIDLLVIQEIAGREGIDLHDITGDFQRVIINLALPVSPITALQVEGRINRIGLKSNAIFEYPILGLSVERYHFGNKINNRVGTTENLAMGSKARDLRRSFKDGFLNASASDPSAEQGIGGKEYDAANTLERENPFQMARNFYYTNLKKTSKNKSSEGIDYFATPEPVGFKMVEWLGLSRGQDFLEPSAGHGAIARFAPDGTRLTAIEPSMNLVSLLTVNVEGNIKNERFEDFDIHNKFDGIAMNPPFGTAGKTAAEHLEKAFSHLRQGGRVAALVPAGPSMQKRIDKMFEADEKGKYAHSDIHHRTIIKLPSVTFQRAGTQVNTEIHIFDRVDKALLVENGMTKEEADNFIQNISGPSTIDLTYIDDVNTLFDTLESLGVADKVRIPEKKETPKSGLSELVTGGRGALLPDKKPVYQDESGFVAEFFIQKHSKTKEDLFSVRLMEQVPAETFALYRSKAKGLGGSWSSYRREGMIPAFLFRSADNAVQFTRDLNNNTLSEPDMVYNSRNEKKVLASLKKKLSEQYTQWAKDNQDYDEFEYFLEQEIGISVDNKGIIDVNVYNIDALLDEVLQGETIRVYHGTSDKLLGKISKEGLIPQKVDVNRNGMPSQGVYVSTLPSGKAMEGYLNRAANKLGGNGIVLSAKVQYNNLQPDPDDADIQSGGYQFVIPKIDPQNIEQFDPPTDMVYEDLFGNTTPIQTRFGFDFQPQEEEVSSELTNKKPEKQEVVKKITTLKAYKKGKLQPGEFSLVEVQARIDGGMFFNGSVTINSPEDVAFLLRSLQTASVENAIFVGIRKDGTPVISHHSQGGMSGTVIDAMSASRFIKDNDFVKFYMVHNHPSGNLRPSESDYLIANKLEDINKGSKVEFEFIIIDVDSGFFTIFNPKAKSYEEWETLAEDYYQRKGIELKDHEVYKFDKLAFTKDVTFMEPAAGVQEMKIMPGGRPEMKIRQSLNVAEFVSAMRLSTGNKLGALILNRSNKITANYFIPLNWSVEKMAFELNAMAGRHNSNGGVIFYDNAEIKRSRYGSYSSFDKTDTEKKIDELKSKMGDLEILDYISVPINPDIDVRYDASGHYSRADEGMLEPEAEYKTKPILDLENKIADTKDRIVETLRQKEAKKKELSKRINVQGDMFAGDLLKPKVEQSSMFDVKQDDSLDNIQRILLPFDHTIARLKDELKGLENRLNSAKKESAGEQDLFAGVEDSGNIQSDNFKKWFAGSKIVDENGNPLVVYHGTQEDFDEYRVGKEGGIFFTESRNLASRYSQFINNGKLKNTPINKASVIPVYLKITNPKVIDFHGQTVERLKTRIDAAKRQGHDGIIIKNGRDFGDPVGMWNQYVIFEPNQAKSAIGNNGDFNPDDPNILRDSAAEYKNTVQTLKDKIATVSDDKILRDKYRSELNNLEENPPILNDPPAPYKTTPPAASSSGKLVNTRMKYLYELLAQKMLSVQLLQDLVIQKGGKITDETNVVILENMAASAARSKMENFHSDIFDPLLTTISDILKKTEKKYGDNVISEFDKYLRAKHSPERNKFMFTQNGRDQNADFTDEEAEMIINSYESLFSGDEIANLWDGMNKATDFTLQKNLESGMLDQEGYEYIKSMNYEHYVPLRGWKDSRDDIFDYQETSRSSTAFQGMVKAKGRTSESAFVLSYVQSMANSAIVAGEKNKVKQAAAQMILDNKGMKDLFRFLVVYTVDTGQKDPDGKPITYETVIKPEKDLWEEGKVQVSKNHSHEIKRPKWMSKQHEVQLFMNGQKVVLVYTDPNVANAINNENSWEPELTRWMQKYPGKVTRWLSANFTAKNPAFMPINQIRDLGYAVVSHGLKYGTAANFVKNLPRARKAIIRATRGESDIVNNLEDKLHEEWRLAGGPTGYIHLDDVKDIEKDVIKQLSRALGTNSKWDKAMQMKLLKDGGKLLENLAKRSEDLSRFATYLTMLDNGYSHIQAVNGSKEITVNFNSKGRITGALGSMFAFFNASMQGGVNFGKLGYKHKGKFAMVGASFMALGFINALLASLWSDDDENGDSMYDAMGDWIKENNLTIPTGRGFITIPMPFGFRTFFAWGVLAHDVIYGKKDAGKAILGGVNSVFESISPVNPTGFFSEKSGLGIRPLVPTLAIPWYDLAINEDFAGRRLYQQPFTTELEKKQANSQQGLKYVSPYIKSVTDFLYKAGGGDEINYKSYLGADSLIHDVPRMMDINPSKIEHLFDSYLGGRFQFWNQTLTTATEILKGAAEATQTGELKSILDDVPLNTVPVLRRLYQEPWQKPYWNKYYQYREEIELFKSVKNQYGKLMDITKFRIMENQAVMQEKTATFDSYDQLIQELNVMAGDKNTPKDMVKDLISRREQMVQQLVKKLSSIDSINNIKP